MADQSSKVSSLDISTQPGEKSACGSLSLTAKVGIAFVVLGLALGLGLGLGLKKSSTSGTALSLPALKPPVTAATPAGLSQSRRRRLVQTEVQTIKDRLFSPGPTDFTTNLGKIDTRFTELSTRAAEFSRKCLTDVPQKWLPGGGASLPGNLSFPMWLQCSEVLSSSLRLLFGVGPDNFAYVAELQTGTPTMAILARAPMNGTMVEVVQVILPGASLAGIWGAMSWFFVSANKNTRDLQLSVAANRPEAGTGVGCGMRMHGVPAASSGSPALFLVTGEVADPFNPNPCSGASSVLCIVGNSSLTTLPSTTCLSRQDLATFSSPMAVNITINDVNSTAVWTLATSIISGTGLPSLTSFNTAS